MANNKELEVIGFIIRNGEKMKRDELAKAEQVRLAANWNRTAMEAAGYTPVLNTQQKNDAESKGLKSLKINRKDG